jgi:hypothetical protein
VGIAGATTALLAALLGAAAEDARPVRIACPVHQTTTVVFPEPLRQLRSPGRPPSLALAVQSTRPRGVITIRPTAHPAQGTVEFRGPTMTLRILLETTADGTASEVRVGPDGGLLAPAPAPAPSAEAAAPPGPVPPAVAPPAAVPTPPPAAPVPPPVLDMEGLLRAKPVAIDRKEGRPGQRPMILVDALHGEEWIWLRFRLEGGAAERVEEVSWEQGPLTRFVQEAAGRDLRLVVQVPRASVTRKTRITVRLADGPSYRFSLSSSTLTNFVKELFK